MRMYKRKYKTNLIYKLCSWQALFRITCVMNTTFVKILKQLKQQNTLKMSCTPKTFVYSRKIENESVTLRVNKSL